MNRHTGCSVIYRFATLYGLSTVVRSDLLLNDFVYRLIKQNSLEIFEPNARRTFIHVLDAAGSIFFALKNIRAMSNNVFNVGDSKINLTKQDACIRIMGR